ncbi:hypothetical protein MKW92_004686, partial [Papaver armeniacum]
MESTMVDPKTSVGGGVQDVYGEDRSTEDQLVTPWTFSIARDAHYYLRGLLPRPVLTQELQEKKVMQSLRKYEVPLQRYMDMMDLQERNERLFYKLLIDNVEESLPIVYTPTVGEACQKYDTIFKGVLGVLKNWLEKDIQVIIVLGGGANFGSWGSWLLDQQDKLWLWTSHRSGLCLPITIDVGTNSQKLLDNEFYIGLKQKRATGQEYADLLHEFMSAVKQNYGEKVLVQFEDFANHNAFELLSRYSKSHLVLNDDIRTLEIICCNVAGTASLVVLSGSLQRLKLVGGTLPDHKFLFLGAGEVTLEISKQKIWLMDSKQPWAHEHEPVKELIDVVKAIKPTILIGFSGR